MYYIKLNDLRGLELNCDDIWIRYRERVSLCYESLGDALNHFKLFLSYPEHFSRVELIYINLN